MYSSAYSSYAGALASVFSGKENRDDDYEAVLRAWATLDNECASRRDGVVHLMEVQPDNPRPDAAWRKRFAEFSGQFRTPKVYFALVSTSTLIRGVLTAVRWLRPTSNMVDSSHATVDEAIRWAEAHRGQPIPVLADLIAEAREKAIRGAGGASSAAARSAGGRK